MKNSTTMNKSQTDWKRLNSMTDENIGTSDIPAVMPEMFAKAIVYHGIKVKARKAQLTLRVDQDILTWFKSRGHGYQTQINALLRAYMEASKSKQQ
jgi:uncharacterized protein (DUF4415 family)